MNRAFVLLCFLVVSHSCTSGNTDGQGVHKDYCITKKGNTLMIKDRYGSRGGGATGNGIYVIHLDNAGELIRITSEDTFPIYRDTVPIKWNIEIDSQKHFSIVLGDSLGTYAEFHDSVWTVFNCEKALDRLLLLMSERLKEQRETYEKKEPRQFSAQ